MDNKLQLYFETRQRRLKLQREADDLEQQEKDILYELTKQFEQPKVTIVVGGFVLKAERKQVALVTDWAAVLQHIKATGEVDLLQKRLTESAVKARWDNQVQIPGVEAAHNYTVTINQQE